MSRGAFADVNMNGIDQRTRIWEPRPLLLVDFQSNEQVFDPTEVEFTVPTPDARVQVNVSVIVVPDPSVGDVPIPYNVLGDDGTGAPLISALLWLAAWQRAPGGLLIPTTDLVGHRAVPQSIPLDPGLMGYSETVLADCEAVKGVLTISQAGIEEGGDFPPLGTWWLRTRYQPVAGCDICADEWKEIVSKASPSVPAALTVIAPP
jgi:hypothetical protein